MPWQDLPADADTPIASVDFINQFVEAYNQRLQAGLGGTRFSYYGTNYRFAKPYQPIGPGVGIVFGDPAPEGQDHDDYGQDPDQKPWSIASLQADLELICGTFCNPGSGLPAGDPDLPLPYTVETWRAAAGIPAAGFTRKFPKEVDHVTGVRFSPSGGGVFGDHHHWSPSAGDRARSTVDARVYRFDGQAWQPAPGSDPDLVEATGLLRFGDALGPWIFNELQAGLNVLLATAGHGLPIDLPAFPTFPFLHAYFPHDIAAFGRYHSLISFADAQQQADAIFDANLATIDSDYDRLSDRNLYGDFSPIRVQTAVGNSGGGDSYYYNAQTYATNSRVGLSTCEGQAPARIRVWANPGDPNQLDSGYRDTETYQYDGGSLQLSPATFTLVADDQVEPDVDREGSWVAASDPIDPGQAAYPDTTDIGDHTSSFHVYRGFESSTYGVYDEATGTSTIKGGVFCLVEHAFDHLPD